MTAQLLVCFCSYFQILKHFSDLTFTKRQAFVMMGTNEMKSDLEVPDFSSDIVDVIPAESGTKRTAMQGF